jgi:hypothetical protein
VDIYKGQTVFFFSFFDVDRQTACWFLSAKAIPRDLYSIGLLHLLVLFPPLVRQWVSA